MVARVKLHFIIIFMFLLTLVLLSSKLPFSKLYRVIHNYESLFKQVQDASKVRTEVGKNYFYEIDKLDPTNQSLPQNIYLDRLKERPIRIAFGLITVKRSSKDTENIHESSLDYLIQSASLLDHNLRHYEFLKSSVPFICNVEEDPESHKSAVNLYKYFPYSERYGTNNLGVPPLFIPYYPLEDRLFDSIRDIDHKTKYQKETFDYAFCLKTAAALKPQFVILLEDDVLPHKDFPNILEHLLISRLNQIKNDHYNNNDILYLKLYFPAKWQGFGMDFVSILDLFSACAVFAGAITTISLVIKQTGCKDTDLVIDFKQVYNISFIVLLIVLWFLGRQNVNELRRLSRHFYRLKASEGCCTQAMLYPLKEVDSLVKHLVATSPHTHTDLAIMDYASESALPALQIEPSLFYHSGMITTLAQQQFKHPEEFIFHL